MNYNIEYLEKVRKVASSFHKNFSTGDFSETSDAVGEKLACFACHAKSEAGYGPFPEFYAPLRDAKNFGKGNPENLTNRTTLPSEKLPILFK